MKAPPNKLEKLKVSKPGPSWEKLIQLHRSLSNKVRLGVIHKPCGQLTWQEKTGGFAKFPFYYISLIK